MKEIRRVLLWEIIRYSPNIFFVLEACSQHMRNQLYSDVSYLQYFLEETFYEVNIRSLNEQDCRDLLKSRLNS